MQDYGVAARRGPDGAPAARCLIRRPTRPQARPFRAGKPAKAGLAIPAGGAGWRRTAGLGDWSTKNCAPSSVKQRQLASPGTRRAASRKSPVTAPPLTAGVTSLGSPIISSMCDSPIKPARCGNSPNIGRQSFRTSKSRMSMVIRAAGVEHPAPARYTWQTRRPGLCISVERQACVTYQVSACGCHGGSPLRRRRTSRTRGPARRDGPRGKTTSTPNSPASAKPASPTDPTLLGGSSEEVNAGQSIGFRQFAAFAPCKAALLTSLGAAVSRLVFPSQVGEVFGIARPTDEATPVRHCGQRNAGCPRSAAGNVCGPGCPDAICRLAFLRPRSTPRSYRRRSRGCSDHRQSGKDPESGDPLSAQLQLAHT